MIVSRYAITNDQCPMKKTIEWSAGIGDTDDLRYLIIVNMIMKRERRSSGGSQDESRERKEEGRVKIPKDQYDNGGNVIVCICIPSFSFSYNIKMV